MLPGNVTIARIKLIDVKWLGDVFMNLAVFQPGNASNASRVSVVLQSVELETDCYSLLAQSQLAPVQV